MVKKINIIGWLCGIMRVGGGAVGTVTLLSACRPSAPGGSGDRCRQAGGTCSSASDCKGPTCGQAVSTEVGEGGPVPRPASPGVVSQQRPGILWDVDVGSVISASATLAPVGPDHAWVALAGSHSGRFVGVVVDGPSRGQIIVDVVVDGMIFTRASMGADALAYFGGDDDVVYAVAPSQGRIVWSQHLGDCWPTRAAGPEGVRCDVDGGPTVLAGGDLILGADGVYRLGARGQQRWHYVSDASVPGTTHVYSTPVVVGEQVVFGGYDGYVTALDAADGALRWRFAVGADVDGTAAVGPDGSVVIGADDGRVYALDREGVLLWSFVTGGPIRSAIVPGPNGVFYVSSFDGKLYALNADGTLRWSYATQGPLAAAPVVDRDGRIIVGSRDDQLHAVGPTGARLWTVPFPGDIDAPAVISPSGTIVVGCDDGYLRALGMPVVPG